MPGPTRAAPRHAPAHQQDPDPSTLAEAHAEWLDVRRSDAPHTLLGGCFGVSGSIPRVTLYEAGNPQHASQWWALAGRRQQRARLPWACASIHTVQHTAPWYLPWDPPPLHPPPSISLS